MKGFEIASDLFKAAGTHKYIKREGTKGNYKYFYKLPDGRVVSEEDAATHHRSTPEKMNANSRRDHIRRLIVARKLGKHSMSDKEIAEEVGSTAQKVRDNVSNMAQRNRNAARRAGGDHTTVRRQDVGHDRHGYTDEEIGESHGPAHSPAAAAEAPAAAEEAPAPARRPRARSGRAAADARVAGARAEDHSAPAAEPARAPARRGRRRGPSPYASLAPDYDESAAAPAAPATPAPAAPAPAAAAPAGRKTPEELEALRAQLRERGMYSQDTARARAEEAAARVATRESAPSSPAARDVATGDPSFSAADRPVQEMVEAQARGENPYLKRAQDIYHNIRHDVKPERKAVVDHVMSAIAAIKSSGQPLNETNLVAKYKELSGKRIRGISGIAEDFERGTFMTLEEVMGNAPVNVEVERMKRGYAAKQFARVKPFLKDDFTTRNPGAPPPYPTFGDIKTWNQHGTTRPSWAGNTNLAVPRELYDAAPKGADGKVKYPPNWMPLHLMPVWNYAAKKAINDGGNPYEQSPLAMDQSGRATQSTTGNQASREEGRIKAAIRKYVVMRGGAENLTDIPTSKLSEVGLSQADIFKGEGNDFDRILRTKIIDPVGLTKVLNEMGDEPTKKSWALTIDLNKSAASFERSDLRKSQGPCWDGYERTPGTKAGEKGSCKKKSEKKAKFTVPTDDEVKKSRIAKVRGLLSAKSRS